MEQEFKQGKVSFLVRGIIRIILILYSIIVLYPLVWNFISSLKTSREFYKNTFGLPKKLYLYNYVNAFVEGKIDQYFFNSVWTTFVIWVFAIMLGAMSAYVIARYDFRSLRFLRSLYISTLFVPRMLLLVPTFLLLNQMHATDNLIAYCIAMIANHIPFILFVLIGFFKGISRTYEEAAMIDGCGYFGILFKIIAPMAKPGIATVSIFVLIWQWNEYVFSSTLLTSIDKLTLPIGLRYLMEVQEYATDWGALFAGLVLAMIPTVTIYLIFNKQITAGLSAGGIKG